MFQRGKLLRARGAITAMVALVALDAGPWVSSAAIAADMAKTLHITFQVAETGFDPVKIHDYYSGTVVEASDSMEARTSTLPRFRWPISRSRSAGSYWRSSSGNLKDKSKNRLLTERISSPKRPARALVSVSGVEEAVLCCALA